MDLAMPGMDGYETARRLREPPQPPLLVALSGYGRDEDRQRTRRAGFVAYLVKPADPSELRALLGRTAGLLRLARATLAASARAITRRRRTQGSGADGLRLSPQAVDGPVDDGALNSSDDRSES